MQYSIDRSQKGTIIGVIHAMNKADAQSFVKERIEKREFPPDAVVGDFITEKEIDIINSGHGRLDDEYVDQYLRIFQTNDHHAYTSGKESMHYKAHRNISWVTSAINAQVDNGKYHLEILPDQNYDDQTVIVIIFGDWRIATSLPKKEASDWLDKQLLTREELYPITTIAFLDAIKASGSLHEALGIYAEAVSYLSQNILWFRGDDRVINLLRMYQEAIENL